jgi:hypothetical protein
MTEKKKTDDARKTAIRGFQDREASAQRSKADKQAIQQANARRQDQHLLSWANSAYQTIYHGVMAANDASLRDGSPYVLSSAPDTSISAVSYEVRRSGSLKVEATLTFALDADGFVRPDTSARGCEEFPEPMAVGEVTAGWAEDVAQLVLIAVLGGQRMRIPD